MKESCVNLKQTNKQSSSGAAAHVGMTWIKIFCKKPQDKKSLHTIVY